MSKKWERALLKYETHCRKIRQATSIDINESPVEKRSRIKKLEADYVDWFNYYFPNYAKKPCAWFHKKIARIIIGNKRCNLLAEIYRSGAKSVHLGMGLPLYLYFKGELKYMLLVGQTEPKSKKLLSKIQSQLQSNQRLINDYGKKFKFGDWSGGDFGTTDGVRFHAISIGQSPRGASEDENRPDFILVDDVDTKERCYNTERSIKAYEQVCEDILGTFDEDEDATQRFVVANNNIHKNSIINQFKKAYHRIIRETRDAGERTEHFIISIPAVKDLVDFIPNWPEKTSSEYWRKKYRKSPNTRSFLREYMHMHIIEGRIFKNKHIVYKKRLRLNQYDALVFYGDLSYKKKGDYKAGMLIGKKGREYHILKIYNRQSSRAAMAQWLYDLYEDWNLEKYNVSYYIEGLFAMDEFVNDFDLEGDKRNYHIPVTADKRPKANKFDRIEAMLGYYERHNIFINEKERESPDTVVYTEHLLAFEKGSSMPDDAPDAQQGAISKLNRSTISDNLDSHHTTSRSDVNSTNPNRY